ncbi:MAG: hypothetical protein OXB84_09080 [Halobacteriovoraceae bacterium]|nr:hypothetical protein [Halobacteriovoraceae bacterium]
MILFLSILCQSVHAANIHGGILINRKTNDALALACTDNTAHCEDNIELILIQNQTVSTKSSPLSLTEISEDYSEILHHMTNLKVHISQISYSLDTVYPILWFLTGTGIVYRVLKPSLSLMANPQINRYPKFMKNFLLPHRLPFTLRAIFSTMMTDSAFAASFSTRALLGSGISLIVPSLVVKFAGDVADQSQFAINQKRLDKHLEFLLDADYNKEEKEISQTDFIAINSILSDYSIGATPVKEDSPTQ